MTRPGLPTAGHHTFVGPWDGADTVTIDGGHAHHLAVVLRIRVDDPVSLADGSGLVAQARVAGVFGSRRAPSVKLEIQQEWVIDQPPTRVSVVQGLPKGRKMDEVVQRLTEVGVDRIRPTVTARTIKLPTGDARTRLLERWQAVALAAAQQSRRPRLPVIDLISDWPPEGAAGVVLWEDSERPLEDAVSQVVADTPPAEVTVAIGPEGGLAADEVAMTDLVDCRLGATILRTETAGMVGAALLSHALGRYT